MKKILVLLPLLVLAAACGAPSANQETANNSATPAPTPTPAATVSEADMTAKEKAAWDTLKTKDYEAFGNMRASDYTEVTADGVHDKASVLASIKDVNITDVTFSDWKTLSIDKDAFIVVYTVVHTGTYKGFPVPPGPYRAATAWANRDGKWLAIYHQETAAATAPPPPPAAGQ
ncbi:MAG: nuclear transport factor 2 family protein [Acidobacteria bacterium]|nr:nuclear transport factor 2 family protein [Acidobacteriota bacterium]